MTGGVHNPGPKMTSHSPGAAAGVPMERNVQALGPAPTVEVRGQG